MRTAFVELKPRFPLFGGWQTEFTFGYSLPLHSIVSRLADGRLRLKTDFSTPFESMVVDDLTVKVTGPVPGRIAPCVGPSRRVACSTQQRTSSGLTGIARGHVPAKCRFASLSLLLSAECCRVSHLRNCVVQRLPQPRPHLSAELRPAWSQACCRVHVKIGPPTTRHSGFTLTASTACCPAGGAACRHTQLDVTSPGCLKPPAGLQLVLPRPGLPSDPCCPTGGVLPDGTSSRSADVSSCTLCRLPWPALGPPIGAAQGRLLHQGRHPPWTLTL